MSEHSDSNVNMETGRTEQTSCASFTDPLHLTNSDHPGLLLVAVQFSGTNFLSWSRAVKMALGAKVKLGFINGMCARPEEGSVELDKWIRCDYMVMCWVLNSMKPDIAEQFMYVVSAKELWDEIIERFSESNAPLVYQLQKEISDIKQDNLSVSGYYGKRKRAWDELQSLQGVPVCTCGVLKSCTCLILKKLLDREATTQLMQFLMGLNDPFENIRNSILAMDPLPSVNRAFHMVTQIERQKEITAKHAQHHEILAAGRFQNSTFEKGQSSGKGGDYKRDYKKAKMDRQCTYCKEKGHVKETCSKLVGIPDWYKELKGQGSGKPAPGGGKFIGNVEDVAQFGPRQADHPLIPDAESTAMKEKVSPDEHMINALIAEATKKVRGQGGDGNQYGSVNFAGYFN